MTNPRSIDQLVEAQVRRWQAAHPTQPAEEQIEPPITLSREHGALGADIARRVAERMGFELWDKALLHAVAERTGASEVILASLDEHTRSGLRDMLAGMVYGVANTEGEYVRELARVIYAVGVRGKAVFLGRGASFVLNPRSALRVRIVAPLEVRVARIMAAKALSREAAEKEIAHLDQERARFNQRSWARDTKDLHAYDLVLNTAFMSVDGAAEVIRAAHQAKFHPRS